MHLTLTGIDSCTDIGMPRTLEITDTHIAITDRRTSTDRNHRFVVPRAPTDSVNHAPILRNGRDATGQPYTLVEFYSEIPLPCVTCRIQAWHSDPYNLFVCLIALEQDPYTTRPYQVRGPFFRLDDVAMQQTWDAFLAALGDAPMQPMQPMPPMPLLMKTVDIDFRAYGGFPYPREIGAVVEPEGWNATDTCGHGLHGLLWGEGDAGLMSTEPEDYMLVLGVPEDAELVDLGDKVKVSKAVLLGYWKVKEAHLAARYVAEHGGAGRAIPYLRNINARDANMLIATGAYGVASAYTGVALTGDYGLALSPQWGDTAIAYGTGAAIGGDYAQAGPGGLAAARKHADGGTHSLVIVGRGGIANGSDRSTIVAGEHSIVTALSAADVAAGLGSTITFYRRPHAGVAYDPKAPLQHTVYVDGETVKPYTFYHWNWAENELLETLPCRLWSRVETELRRRGVLDHVTRIWPELPQILSQQAPAETEQ